MSAFPVLYEHLISNKIFRKYPSHEGQASANEQLKEAAHVIHRHDTNIVWLWCCSFTGDSFRPEYYKLILLSQMLKLFGVLSREWQDAKLQRNLNTSPACPRRCFSVSCTPCWSLAPVKVWACLIDYFGFYFAAGITACKDFTGNGESLNSCFRIFGHILIFMGFTALWCASFEV